ncbi:MarR family winged helix-turn-helix transcriptional regulator [Parvibaculum sp.]|uniref:MarR family winged helix-turn-helix transcriptional regulator n=1 Tax=Parvibaculum sp. TaxID=2024848 RepID=UPI00271F76EF|nr:MarR family winged helix-turn-helix transcriptional regulator [Parvibaculum sp.]MDO9128028.1 MarR family winged helix-turn-helix transcriptional regulator [Parvibaculum sp.]MDP1625511.1 MarR family winged helix-turn-helix transcriptional regulator [Parvibaculum sp.]MDP2149480.1 MarR family winged helix-turn-helix transcriptional regulator [Parvibaculum sp.]MDP3328065.1 MarR family winged helix-turn-helix transcriptional regulator [Parvibaculum sp.]
MAARKPTGNFDLESSLSHLLRRAQQFAYDQFVQQMGDSALTPRQFIVLFAVNEEEGLSQTDLVNRTGIDRSTLADMISRMIKNGLLARRRTAEDARANAVRLTAAGRRALKGAMPKALAAEKALLDVLPKSTQADLMKGLGQLNNAIESQKTEEVAPKAPAKRAAAKPARKTAAKKPAARRKKA